MLHTLEVPTQCACDSSALWLLVLMHVDAIRDFSSMQHIFHAALSQIGYRQARVCMSEVVPCTEQLNLYMVRR